MSSSAINPSMTPLGPVHAHLAGIVRGDAKGEVRPSVNAPTVSEAIAALHRVAQTRGADGVTGVGSDYRRIALVAGLSVQWRVEVMAWGTAVLRVEEPDAEPEAD